MKAALFVAALVIFSGAAQTNAQSPSPTPTQQPPRTLSQKAVTEDLSEGATFTFTINKVLPPFTFRVIPDRQETDEWGNPHSTVRDVEVFRGSSRQPVQHLAGCEFSDMEAPPRDSNWFHTDDFNFDGYNDVYLLTNSGATGNTYGCVWIYNSNLGLFEYSKEFSGLTGYRLDPATKTIATFERGGMVGLVHTAGLYTVENNRPVLILSDHQDWDFDKKQFHCIVQERRGTTLVTTHDAWTASENGDPACDTSEVFPVRVGRHHPKR